MLTLLYEGYIYITQTEIKVLFTLSFRQLSLARQLSRMSGRSCHWRDSIRVYIIRVCH